MMNRIQTNTEEKILLVAKEIFVKKGFDAVRMDKIAILAGVNKSLLKHKYEKQLSVSNFLQMMEDKRIVKK